MKMKLSAADFEGVDENATQGSGHDVPTGTYIVEIKDVVEDHDFINYKGEENPRIGIVWDIAEGQYTGMFSDEWSMNNSWISTQYFYYQSNKPFFKKLYKTLEACNKGYTWDWTPSSMIGKKLGVGIRHDHYTYNGTDKSKVEISGLWTLDEVRDGKAKMPKDRDRREKQTPEQVTSAYDDASVPF